MHPTQPKVRGSGPRGLRIPVPGLNSEVGLGTAIANVTSAIGVQPCSGCNKRKEALDERFRFAPMRTKG